MKNRLAIILAVAAVAGCSSDPLSTFANAIAQPACAPNDGPALQLLMEGGRGVASTTLRVMVYRSQEEADGRTWSVAPPHQFGIATLCPLNGTCEDATSGEIRFARDSDALRGVVDLRFAKAGRVRSSFDAGWNEIAVTCG